MDNVKPARGHYRQFLVLVRPRTWQGADHLAAALGIHKRNLHRHLHRADAAGLQFERHYLNGGLAVIRLTSPPDVVDLMLAD